MYMTNQALEEGDRAEYEAELAEVKKLKLKNIRMELQKLKDEKDWSGLSLKKHLRFSCLKEVFTKRTGRDWVGTRTIYP